MEVGMSKKITMNRESIYSLATTFIAVTLAAAIGIGVTGVLWITIGDQFGSGAKDSLIGEILVAAIGAFAGAWVAFKLERSYRKAEDRRRNAEAASLVGVRLSLMYTAYRNYRDRFVSPALAKHPRETLWHLLEPGALHIGPIPELDLGGLKFLIQGQDVQVVADVGMEEVKYRALNEIIERRSRMHHEEMQRLMEERGLRGSQTMGTIKAAVGPRIVTSMENYTDFILKEIDPYMESITKVAVRLKKASKTLLESERVVGFEPKTDLKKDGKQETQQGPGPSSGTEG